MRLIQGLVFAVLTEKNCLFLFRTEIQKNIRARFLNFDRSTKTNIRWLHKIQL